jgi:CheY-like chemotaxis protein/HPt (histidine-containing phosphotransfer) domain-containing protein
MSIDTSALQNKKLLLVEDDIVNQMLFQRSVLKLNMQVAIAGNGEKAIELLADNIYDLIIMDIHLPDIDGCETTEIIRGKLKNKTPIIAITASPMDEELKRCLAAGMNGYIRKPFTIDQFVNAVEHLIPLPEPEEEQEINYILNGDGVTVDLTFLKTVAEDDIEYMHLMINTFIDYMPATITKMEKFNADEDNDNLAKTAHFAKSSLSVITIKEMFEQAVSMEADAKKGEVNNELMNESIKNFNQLFINSKIVLNKFTGKE